MGAWRRRYLSSYLKTKIKCNNLLIPWIPTPSENEANNCKINSADFHPVGKGWKVETADLDPVGNKCKKTEFEELDIKVWFNKFFLYHLIHFSSHSRIRCFGYSRISTQEAKNKNKTFYSELTAFEGETHVFAVRPKKEWGKGRKKTHFSWFPKHRKGERIK